MISVSETAQKKFDQFFNEHTEVVPSLRVFLQEGG
jgi:Fe-S cluster assembly iron-binding protein IscA